MLKEFKTFAMRGNVLDLAVGIIIGGAFGGIVSSFVNDILMPPLGLLLGRLNYTDMLITLSGDHYATLADAEAAGAVTLNYGRFIGTMVDFLIVALAIFLLIRQINRLRPAHRGGAHEGLPVPPQQRLPSRRRDPQCTSALSDGDGTRGGSAQRARWRVGPAARTSLLPAGGPIQLPRPPAGARGVVRGTCCVAGRRASIGTMRALLEHAWALDALLKGVE